MVGRIFHDNNNLILVFNKKHFLQKLITGASTDTRFWIRKSICLQRILKIATKIEALIGMEIKLKCKVKYKEI